MKKSIIAALLIFCLLFTGCELTDNLAEDLLGTQPEEERVTTLTDLSLVYYPNPAVHPLLDTSLANQKVHTYVYQPAFTFDQQLEIMYGCASDVKQNGNSITITPDTARKFSDGSALTAGDIAESFRFVLSHPESPYYRRLENVENVTTSGGTVVITLKNKEPGALYCMDIPIVKTVGEQFYGCGDYKFGTHNDVPVLLANGDAAPASSPIYLLTPDSAKALGAMFNSGVLNVLPGDLIEQGAFSVSREYKTATYLTNTMIYVGVNNQKISSAMRRALSAMIPREDIVDNVLMGLGQSVTLPFYPGWKQLPSVSTQAPKDRLIELFTAAGLHAQNGELHTENEEKPCFKLLVCKDNKEHVAIAGKLHTAALALGMEITVDEVDKSTFNYRLEQGNYELYIARYTLNQSLSCSELFIAESAPNYCGAPSSALSNAYKKFIDGGKPADYIATLQQECPILPVAFLKTPLYHTYGISPTGSLSFSRPLGELSKWTVS